MNMAFIREVCERMQTPALAKRYYDAAIGLTLILGVQLISIPTQIALDLHRVNLPASILVLFLVLITMTIAGACNENVGRFYHERLRGPTDFLGRHMAFGFVAFFILLIRDHIDNASDIPKLAGVFGKQEISYFPARRHADILQYSRYHHNKLRCVFLAHLLGLPYRTPASTVAANAERPREQRPNMACFLSFVACVTLRTTTQVNLTILYAEQGHIGEKRTLGRDHSHTH